MYRRNSSFSDYFSLKRAVTSTSHWGGSQLSNRNEIWHIPSLREQVSPGKELKGTYQGRQKFICSGADTVLVCFGNKSWVYSRAVNSLVGLSSYPRLWPQAVGGDWNNRIADGWKLIYLLQQSVASLSMATVFHRHLFYTCCYRRLLQYSPEL